MVGELLVNRPSSQSVARHLCAVVAVASGPICACENATETPDPMATGHRYSLCSSDIKQPIYVGKTISMAPIESTPSPHHDGELASTNPQADGQSPVDSDELVPSVELIELQDSDVRRYAARPLARLWSLAMLSCGLAPTVKNELLANRLDAGREYRARLRTMRNRVLDRRFHRIDEHVPGYLLNFYFANDDPAAHDDVDDQHVRVEDFLLIASQEGWNVDRRFFERPLSASSLPPLRAEVEETPPPQVRGATRWKDAHHRMLLGLLKQLSTDNDQFLSFFDALVVSSKAKLEGNVRSQVDVLLKSEIGKVVVDRWTTSMQFTNVGGPVLSTFVGHVIELALFLHRRANDPPDTRRDLPP